MYSSRLHAAAAALALFSGPQAFAQAESSAGADKIMMTRPVAKIFDAQVIGGNRVSGSAWPATFL